MNARTLYRTMTLVVCAVTAVGAAGCSGAKDKPQLSESVFGSCAYTNSFSNAAECRDYLGAWDDASAQADCTHEEGAFTAGSACANPDVLGECLLADGDRQTRVLALGSDPAKCSDNRTGCEVFAGGYWSPRAACGGPGADEIVVLENAYPQPKLSCVPPKQGEPAGASEGGQVCTWQGIHGATEEGRRYSDYSDCSMAMRQRPYAPVPADDRASQPDARLQGSAYQQEQQWVMAQTRAQACTCCHSKAAPKGAAVFDVDTEGSFANQFHDRGLAMGAGWIDSVAFGSFHAAQNNGFEKSTPEHPDWSIFGSTDPVRMRAFFEAELAHRGLTRADFANAAPAAGFLDSQLKFRPSACAAGEGIAADGRITWKPGRARYVYVMEADATSPTVPPNLDLPAGTLWRIDVPEDGAPVASGTVKYGEVPAGMTQRFPASGAPSPLVSGRSYYLYASADVLVPISRCLFVAP